MYDDLIGQTLTVSEAASFLRVSRRSIYRAASDIPGLMAAPGVISGCRLREYLARCTFAPPDELRELPRPCVYVIRQGISGPVKVGYTRSLGVRMDDLQRGNPDQLELVIATPGTLKNERRLHKLFAKQRVLGEWFRLEGPVMEFVSSAPSYRGPGWHRLYAATSNYHGRIWV